MTPAMAQAAGKTVLVAGMEVPALPFEVVNKAVKQANEEAKAEISGKGASATRQKDAVRGGVAKRPVVEDVTPEEKAKVLAIEEKTRRRAERHRNTSRSAPAPKQTGTAGSRATAPRKGLEIRAKLVAKVAPGVNKILKISKGHVNRIITPFELATVETMSNATIESKGESLYIASNSDYPVTMFIHEKGEEDPAISLTLLPSPIPPRQIRLVFDGESMSGFATSGAKHWERSHDYVDGITSAMAEIAKGRIPHGYGFRKWKPTDPMPECRNKQQGISITPGQVLSGDAQLYVVSVVQNISAGTVELSEQLCYEDRVLAAAFWPKVVLRPGEKTELYVAYRRPRPEEARTRKSLLAR